MIQYDLGSLPKLPPLVDTSTSTKLLAWIGTYAPLLIVAGCIAAMAISALHRYCPPFREWWERHVSDRVLKFFERHICAEEPCAQEPRERRQ